MPTLYHNPCGGFQIRFDSGIRLSVAIGPCTYSGNYEVSPSKGDLLPSETAEIAVFGTRGSMLPLLGDTVAGYVPISTVIAIASALQALPDDADDIAVSDAVCQFLSSAE